MIAFEIRINGRHVQTISAGDFGLLSVGIRWCRIQRDVGDEHEEICLQAHGLEGIDGDAIAWLDLLLNKNDEVTLRIVEIDGPGNPPDDRIPRDSLHNRPDFGV